MLCQIMELLRPKTGIPWQVGFGFSLFLIILYLSFHENHKHVQGWNPATTTSFTGRQNNNNNNNRDKTNKKLGGIIKEFVVVGFQP